MKKSFGERITERLEKFCRTLGGQADADDAPILLRCRHCGVVHDLLCCDAAGADDGMVFCPSCRRQTEADGADVEELPLFRRKERP